MTHDALQQLLDIEEIKQLKARYCRCVATEDWSGFEALFASDLQFVQPGGQTHDGRDAFMAFHRQNVQHGVLWGFVRCYTPEITITGPNSATGIWAMSDIHLWPGGDGPPLGHTGYGHYHEEYVRLEQGWRFRRIQVLYQRVEPREGGLPDFETHVSREPTGPAH